MIGFVASGISTKSSLSATSAFHGGGVLGRAGTGATTHTDPTDILIILIRPSTPATDTSMVTKAMVMGRATMVKYIATSMGVTRAASTTAAPTQITMKDLS